MARGHAIALVTAVGAAVGALLISQRRGESVSQLDPVPLPNTDARTAVLRAALSEIGVQQPSKYWSEVLPAAPGFSGAWCGGFALWALKQAGLAQDIQWEVGRGFCYRLSQTNDPKPGDIVYIDQPYQHHAILLGISGDTVRTVDGNQKGETVAIRERPRRSISAFYSIDSLIPHGANGAV